MLVVSNTSPISNFAAIGRLELLRSQFSTLRIPDAVRAELAAHPDLRTRSAIQTAIRDQWIQVSAPGDSGLLRLLLLELHRGEAEAIALATVLKADIVLMDELEGRQLASRTGFVVTGTLGVLMQAKRAGNIPSIRPEIGMLRSKARFFISPVLEAKIIAAANE